MNGTRRIKIGLTLGLLLTTAGLAGCSTSNSASTISLPPTAPRTVAESQADRDHAKLVEAFGGEIRSPAAHQLLTDIVNRLVQASDRPSETFQVTILNSPVANAFALPSGRLYVTRGLLALANDTSEIAAVLSHEIAHVTLRHASQRNELQARSSLITRVTENVLNNAAEAAVVRDQSRMTLASFSRAQELEADQAGVKVLARAGFDPFGAPRLLTALGRSATNADAGRGNGTELGSTHPATSERISQAQQAARRASAPGIGEADKARYLAAIDGLAYGDDPADGVVRGRAFIHARLGVSFEAPIGFTLENTSQAVLGASVDGARRLLFDAAETPNGQSLEEVLRSTWSDSIEPGSMETATINGLPVATALSRGKEWNFRLSAIRIGTTTYRLIMAAKAGSGDLDGTFRQTLATVRHVQADEARSVQPFHLKVITARDGDTAETLSARMPVSERPLERFTLLNGLDRSGPLKGGESYKIVVD
ncbi:M48 family metalloprotease [Microvirga flavescens]|uniref:M48 family metalloprotease n=1 Tax=Microvirga flavescens TaxID=2249811 RepID=UPI000DD95DF5|nr:M48 family metalloprotease [Microvirga flavescens]